MVGGALWSDSSRRSKNYGLMGPTPAQMRVDNCVGSFVSYCDDSDSHDGVY